MVHQSKTRNICILKHTANYHLQFNFACSGGDVQHSTVRIRPDFESNGQIRWEALVINSVKGARMQRQNRRREKPGVADA